MLVADASCLFEVLSAGPDAAWFAARLALDTDHAAPHMVDAEVLGVVRREFLTGRLDRTAADQIVADLADWPGERFSHVPLLERAWELRATVRSGDALYVALAEGLGGTLVTADRRLAGAAGVRCPVETPSG